MIGARYLGQFDALEKSCDECRDAQLTQGHTPIYELFVANRTCRICSYHFSMLVVAFDVAKSGKAIPQ